MTKNIPLFEHGYVKFVESWGSDERIIEAARQSVGGGFVSWEPYEDHPKGDQGLLSFLFTSVPAHSTPGEFAGMVIETQAPLAVFREWHRHRTFSYNEASARYAPLPDLNYVPTVARCLQGLDTKNKQAQAVKGSEQLTESSAWDWLTHLEAAYRACEVCYQDGLSRGVPKELARLILPVGRFSRMRASANLRNWLHFCTLRMDSAAQFEIRMFAHAVGVMLSERFPRVWKLFIDSKPKIAESFQAFKDEHGV